MAPRSGPGSCVSNVPLLFLHFWPSKLNNRVICATISRPVCDSSLHTPLSCLQVFLRSVKDSLAPLVAETRRTLPKQPTRLTSDQSKHQNDRWRIPLPRKYQTKQQLSWFTCFATVKKTPRKTASLFRLHFKVGSDECDANRRSDCIELMFDVGTFWCFSLTNGWSQTCASIDWK